MIVTKLQLFQVQIKMFLRNAMVLKHSLFRKTPESFKAINVHSTIGKFTRMVQTQMSTKNEQGLVASKLIRVKNASFLRNVLHRFKDLSYRKILWERRVDPSVSLQHSQNQCFSGSCSSSVTLSSATKVRIINLNLSRELSKLLLSSQDNLFSQFLIDTVDRFVVHLQDLACFVCWYFQSEILNDLLYPYRSLVRVSSFAPFTVYSPVGVLFQRAVLTKQTISTVHSTIYLN